MQNYRRAFLLICNGIKSCFKMYSLRRIHTESDEDAKELCIVIRRRRQRPWRYWVHSVNCRRQIWRMRTQCVYMLCYSSTAMDDRLFRLHLFYNSVVINNNLTPKSVIGIWLLPHDAVRHRTTSCSVWMAFTLVLVRTRTCVFRFTVLTAVHYNCFLPHPNNASALPCKTWNSRFCENSNAGKAKLKKYLLTSILLVEKGATFWLWHHVMANLVSKTCTNLYQNRPRFVKDMTKTFWCVFRFTVLTAVHLQNVNAKFLKVE